MFDLSLTTDGMLCIHNTPKWVNDMNLLIDGILHESILTRQNALILRGRLALCDAFVLDDLASSSAGDYQTCLCETFSAK